MAGASLLLTTVEVAALLQVHPKHVYRLIRCGLPAKRVGGEWRFERGEVMAWAGPSAVASADESRPAPVTQARALIPANGDVAFELLLDQLDATRAPSLPGYEPTDIGSIRYDIDDAEHPAA